jgi:signal transduction histidine kinase
VLVLGTVTLLVASAATGHLMLGVTHIAASAVLAAAGGVLVVTPRAVGHGPASAGAPRVGSTLLALTGLSALLGGAGLASAAHLRPWTVGVLALLALAHATAAGWLTGAATVSRYRAPLTAGLGLLAASYVLAAVTPADAGWRLLAAAAAAAGAATLLAMAWRWAGAAGAEASQQVDGLLVDLTEHERRLHDTRRRMHDARATVAGIRAAHEVLSGPTTVGTVERTALEAALEAEIDRLLRLLHGRAGGAGPTRLDEVLPPLVLMWRRRGLDLRYDPAPATVALDEDRLTEMLRNLLDNAAVHAPGASVRLLTDTVGDNVLLSVVDDGPGVAEELRENVLRAGVRRTGSPGDGLGLASVAQLASEAGGELRLLDVAAGTWCLLRLPAASATETGEH